MEDAEVYRCCRCHFFLPLSCRLDCYDVCSRPTRLMWREFGTAINRDRVLDVREVGSPCAPAHTIFDCVCLSVIPCHGHWSWSTHCCCYYCRIHHPMMLSRFQVGSIHMIATSLHFPSRVNPPRHQRIRLESLYRPQKNRWDTSINNDNNISNINSKYTNHRYRINIDSNHLFNNSNRSYSHCHQIRHNNSNKRCHHQIPFRSLKTTCRSLNILFDCLVSLIILVYHRYIVVYSYFCL
jgi:hypothetical protein